MMHRLLASHPIAFYILPGLLGAVLLIGIVFATGQTFGQRCTAAGYTEGAWEMCINRLAHGKVLHPTLP